MAKTKALPVFQYIPETSKLSLKEAYAEYQRLRYNVAQPRLARLEKAGFSDREIYRENAWIRNRPASSIPADEIRNALLDLYKFTMNKRATVKRQRELEEAETDRLKKKGYDIAPEDLPKFRSFMHMISKRLKGKFESARAAEMFAELAQRGLLSSMENVRDVVRHYESYSQHMDEIEREAEKSKGKRGGVSMSNVRKRLGVD